jgi:hypothetical protein
METTKEKLKRYTHNAFWILLVLAVVSLGTLLNMDAGGWPLFATNKTNCIGIQALTIGC